MPPILSINNLSFAHGERTVVQDVSLAVMPGEILVVVGSSGSGKTTLLRLIAGLEQPRAGSITLSDRTLSGPGVFVAPEQRAVGMVFQGLALFPHLTVEGNLGFGLAHLPRTERAQRIAEELASVGLQGLGARYPHQLSGGQQQRVAIARSLVRRPSLILMDEPFSDLDHRTRSQVRAEVLRILRSHGTTAIIVTHDREDAYHVADRIAEMDEGRVVRVDTAEVFRTAWETRPFS
ncbi:MAG TPA: ABC transporter ATP-binding protein [Flavobacteriales bacterium]|nr:ABC transporter ATP-binding protein [Flavobacteriales bacterium]